MIKHETAELSHDDVKFVSADIDALKKLGQRVNVEPFEIPNQTRLFAYGQLFPEDQLFPEESTVANTL
jgi:hypothetical protein